MCSYYRALVIHSPHAGRSEHLPEALAALRQAGIEVTGVIPIAELGALPLQDDNWSKQNLDLVIAAGGDGLIGGVLPYMSKGCWPLGILPLGTSNNTAHALHIPSDIHRAADVIVRGQAQDFDVGIAHPLRQAFPGSETGRDDPGETHTACGKPFLFAHALAVGLHVQFARIATNVVTRERYGPLTYAFATFEVLQHPSVFEVELRFEGLIAPHQQRGSQGYGQHRLARAEEYLPWRCRAFEVAVVNAPLFGGERQFAIPGAGIGDGLLDIVVIEEHEFGVLKRGLARFFGREEREFGLLGSRLAELFGGRGKPPQFRPGQPVTHRAELTSIPGIHHLQARGVTITTETGPQEVTLDGELRLETPLSVHVAPWRLRVLVPNALKDEKEGHEAARAAVLVDTRHAETARASVK